VHLGRQAEHDAAGKRLVRLLAELLAGRQIVIDGFMEGSLQLSHRGPVKTHDVAHTRKVPNEYAVLGIEFDSGAVAPVSHAAHGVSPIAIKTLAHRAPGIAGPPAGVGLMEIRAMALSNALSLALSHAASRRNQQGLDTPPFQRRSAGPQHGYQRLDALFTVA
jgi:hypothetical protein